MVTIKADGLKFKRCDAWDQIENPLEQYDVMPIDLCRVRGLLTDLDGALGSVEINCVSKVGANAVWLPISTDIGMKIFRKVTPKKCEDYFRVMKMAYDAGIGPEPRFCSVVNHRGMQKLAIIQQRLRSDSSFSDALQEIFDVDPPAGRPNLNDWDGDAIPLFVYLKYCGPHRDVAETRAKEIYHYIKERMQKAGLRSKFHKGQQDYGDITSFNIVWSQKKPWLVDFDSWELDD